MFRHAIRQTPGLIYQTWPPPTDPHSSCSQPALGMQPSKQHTWQHICQSQSPRPSAHLPLLLLCALLAGFSFLFFFFKSLVEWTCRKSLDGKERAGLDSICIAVFVNTGCFFQRCAKDVSSWRGAVQPQPHYSHCFVCEIGRGSTWSV